MKKSPKLEALRQDCPEYVKQVVEETISALDDAYNRGFKDSYNRRKFDVVAVLEMYSLFLERNGYMDVDWRTEEPYAIDEFLKEYDKGQTN